ncbi:MAG: hypothetical protein ACPIOQ_12275 [Promethearchaeia archaeon]
MPAPAWWWWCRRSFRGRGECLLLSDEAMGLWCVGEQCGVNKEVFDKAQVFTLEQAIESAARIGYPVMLKASEGGGGKGIRMNANEEELRSNFVQVCGMSGVLTKARLSPVCVAGSSIALSQSHVSPHRHGSTITWAACIAACREMPAAHS